MGTATGSTVPCDPPVVAATIGVGIDVATLGLEVDAVTVGLDAAATVFAPVGEAGDLAFVPRREAPDAPPPLLPPDVEAPCMELEAGPDTTGTITDVPALVGTAGTIAVAARGPVPLLSPDTPRTRVTLII